MVWVDVEHQRPDGGIDRAPAGEARSAHRLRAGHEEVDPAALDETRRHVVGRHAALGGEVFHDLPDKPRGRVSFR